MKQPVSTTYTPQSSITDYLAMIGRIAILSKDQQLHHGRNIREWLDWPDGKEHAPPGIRRRGERSFRRMVESNLRIVVSIAKKYVGNGVAMEDLIQEGNMGLMVAAEKFDPARGYCFTTCAYWWIRQSMTRALANSSRTIRIPCNVTERIRKIRMLQDQWIQDHGLPPSIEDLARASGEDIEKVQQAIEVFAMQPRSLDELVSCNDSSTLEDIIGCDPNCATAWREKEASDDQMLVFMDLIGKLPDDQRFVVDSFVFKQMTQEEIGQQMGVTRQMVSCIYRTAKKQLHALAFENGLAPAVTDISSSRAHSRKVAAKEKTRLRVQHRYENTITAS